MSTSGAQNIVRGVHNSSAWDVAWDVVEDELLGMTLGMAVALRDSSCLGPQIQVTDIERNLARVGAGDVPENTVETLLAPVLLASIVSASVALVGLGGDIAGDFFSHGGVDFGGQDESSLPEERPSNRAKAE